MPRIKNENYNRFREDGLIEIMTEAHILQAIENIPTKRREEGAAMLIALYVTGARPNEILSIKGKDITYKSPDSVYIKLLPSKHGLAREIKVSIKQIPFVRRLYDYTKKLFPEMYIFYHFKNKTPYKRIIKGKNGVRVYMCDTDVLRYHIKKWFTNVIKGSITPYFLRHNRFSSMSSKGASTEQIRLWKGAKTAASVTPYLHLSKEIVDKASKFVY